MGWLREYHSSRFTGNYGCSPCLLITLSLLGSSCSRRTCDPSTELPCAREASTNYPFVIVKAIAAHGHQTGWSGPLAKLPLESLRLAWIRTVGLNPKSGKLIQNALASELHKMSSMKNPPPLPNHLLISSLHMVFWNVSWYLGCVAHTCLKGNPPHPTHTLSLSLSLVCQYVIVMECNLFLLIVD